MNEVEFSLWLIKQNIPKKLCSDYVSRLKKLERSLANCNLEEEYYKNKCLDVLMLFKNAGNNNEMKKVHVGNLPIGKTYLATYKYALTKYIDCMNDISSN